MISQLTSVARPIAGFARGFSYPLRALRFFRQHPGMLRYVAVPFIINLLIFSATVYFGLGWFDWVVAHYAPGIDVWYGVILYYLAWVIALMMTLVIFFFSFTIIGNLVASPFNEFLSERTEGLVRGTQDEQALSVALIFKEARFALFYEVKKMAFFILCMLALLAINFIPLVGAMAYAVLMPLFTLFFLGAEYMAFVSMRKRYSFAQLRRYLFRRPLLMAGFSCSVFVLLAIPFVQLFCIPLAVVGATLLWCDFPGEETEAERN
jgi:CysZ protein